MSDVYPPEKRAYEEAEIAKAADMRRIRANISGAREVTAPQPEPSVHAVDDLSRSTRRALDQQGVSDTPQDGDTAEQFTKTALAQEPGLLKNHDGSDKPIQGVADGQYDGIHGIDLVAADKEGRPVVIEVKEMQDGQAHLNDRPVTTIDGPGDSDVHQMDDAWVRDRWRRLIADEHRRPELLRAGIKPEYLDKSILRSDNAKLWKDVLNDKAVVVVSPRGNSAVGPKLSEQCHARHVGQIYVIKT